MYRRKDGIINKWQHILFDRYFIGFFTIYFSKNLPFYTFLLYTGWLKNSVTNVGVGFLTPKLEKKVHINIFLQICVKIHGLYVHPTVGPRKAIGSCFRYSWWKTFHAHVMEAFKMDAHKRQCLIDLPLHKNRNKKRKLTERMKGSPDERYK